MVEEKAVAVVWEKPSHLGKGKSLWRLDSVRLAAVLRRMEENQKPKLRRALPCQGIMLRTGVKDA